MWHVTGESCVLATVRRALLLDQTKNQMPSGRPPGGLEGSDPLPLLLSRN